MGHRRDWDRLGNDWGRGGRFTSHTLGPDGLGGTRQGERAGVDLIVVWSLKVCWTWSFVFFITVVEPWDCDDDTQTYMYVNTMVREVEPQIWENSLNNEISPWKSVSFFPSCTHYDEDSKIISSIMTKERVKPHFVQYIRKMIWSMWFVKSLHTKDEEHSLLIIRKMRQRTNMLSETLTWFQTRNWSRYWTK